jgi:hypothetical protein
MKRALLLVCACFAFGLACDQEPTSTLIPEPNENIIGISQGIYGKILFWEGDFMPMYPEDGTGGYIYPVMRDVCIFEAVLHEDIEWIEVEIPPGGYARLATDVPTELVKVVHSNKNGYFEVELPPGLYSIFVKEAGYFYANLTSGGYVFPVEVREGKTSEIQFDITYMATY